MGASMTGTAAPVLPNPPTSSARCVLLGGPEALRTPFASELRARLARTLQDPVAVVEVAERHEDTDPMSGPALPTLDPDELDVASCIVLLDANATRQPSWWDLRARCAEYRHEDRLVDAVTTIASNANAVRLLVIAEAGDDDGIRSRRRAHRLARSAGYEVEIDGTPVTSVFYLVVGSPITPPEAITATAHWALSRAGCNRISAAR